MTEHSSLQTGSSPFIRQSQMTTQINTLKGTRGCKQIQKAITHTHRETKQREDFV